MNYADKLQILHAIDLGRDHRIMIRPGSKTFFVEGFVRDIHTGRAGWQAGGDRPIPDTESAIVRAVFSAVLAFVEHEARETFTYRGARVYGPHLDVTALVEIADRVDYTR